MKQVFLRVDSGEVIVIESPKPTIKKNHVIVETLYSAISPGTEGSLARFGQKNLLSKVKDRPDQAKLVFEKLITDGVLNTVGSAFSKLREPMPLGYSAMGKVLEVGDGVNHVQKGDFVAIAGTAYHSEINRVGKNLAIKIPPTLENKKEAAFCALGAIALHGIHQAEIRPGETVGIIGMGLLGRITAKILKAYGNDVIGFDINDDNFSDGSLVNYINVVDKNQDSSLIELKDRNIIDKVIITATSNTNDPIELAMKIVRKRGIICMVGVTKMDIDRTIFYEKELVFKIATSYGPGRYNQAYEVLGVDIPIEYSRFTEGRNISEFLRLLDRKLITLNDLITQEVELNNVPNTYKLITENQIRLGVLIKYASEPSKHLNKIACVEKVNTNKDFVDIGLIGAGNFTRNVILPNMFKLKKFNLLGIASTGGKDIGIIKSLYKFEYYTSNYKDIINDNNIDLVVIATPHDTHAKLVMEALKNNKSVYVEKPLCTNLQELKTIKKLFEISGKHLFVGLNRKFSSHIVNLQKKIKGSINFYEYYVNAGEVEIFEEIDETYKSNNRIIGEAIHFVDTLQFLENSKINDITIKNNNLYDLNSNFSINIVFDSGSMAVINYVTNGTKRYPKEILRITSGKHIYELVNYLKINKDYKRNSKLHLKQDKGFVKQYLHLHQIISGKDTDTNIHNTFHVHEKLLKAISEFA